MKFGLVAVGALLAAVSASEGDSLPQFKRCLAFCNVLRCGGDERSPGAMEWGLQYSQAQLGALFAHNVPLWHRMLGWDCLGNCDYECSRIVSVEREQRGLEPVQFHGKWPFVRVFGIQELFSTLFSMGNFIPNYMGFKLLYSQWRRERDAEYKTLCLAYVIVTVVSMCAWTFSTIFHLKDTWDRERLDYFFAGMTVLSGFHAIVIRFFHLYRTPAKARVFGLVCVGLYVCHVLRLLSDWSYSYNMQVNVIFGLAQNILWVILSVKQFMQVRHRRWSFSENLKDPSIAWTLTPCALVASVVFGMSFELFDFAPLGNLLDAHAMWHFVTIWPTLWWFPYMVKDMEWLRTVKHE